VQLRSTPFYCFRLFLIQSGTISSAKEVRVMASFAANRQEMIQDAQDWEDPMSACWLARK